MSGIRRLFAIQNTSHLDRHLIDGCWGHRPRSPSSTARAAAEPVTQPPLPDGFDWPQQTRDWWAMWGCSPLSAEFAAVDWSFLLDTAVLDAELWHGNVSVATELRLRVACFGATPADRAKLRITFAAADTCAASSTPCTS